MKMVPLEVINERLRAFHEARVPAKQYYISKSKNFPTVIGASPSFKDRYGLSNLPIGQEVTLRGHHWESMMRNLLCLVWRKKRCGALPEDYKIETKKTGETEVKYWRKQ